MTFPGSNGPRPSPFVEGVAYRSRTGTNNVGTDVKVTREGDKYHLELPLVFGGASLWQDAAKVPDPTLAKTDANSIEDNPALKAKVLEICRDIEQTWNTPDVELNIVPSFLRDESSFIPANARSHNEMSNELWSGMSRNRSAEDPLPVLISPAQNSQVITPTLWDVTARPELLAHEVGHILGNTNEGYCLRHYPLDGIMGDELAFNKLDELGATPHPTTADVSTILGNMIERGSLSPALPVSKKEALDALPPSTNDLNMAQTYTPEFDEWMSRTHAQREEAIQKKVEDYLQAHPRQG
ncbi:MAG: hypothetical protein ACT4TC_16595 [Myxococcaceae bacterium]